MACVEKTVLIGYSASQMFALVEKVEDYPKFLPWCGGTEVFWRNETGMKASITIDFKAVRQAFSTENRHHAPDTIEMKLVDGPFRSLTGLWHFKVLAENACKIEFRLDYEFSSHILELLVGPVFSGIANSLVDSFVQRAEEIYG